MDELEISGKRYISSKRIAKENKYHPDYMGQLIRAGKIVGSKVGRAWYVEEDSFKAYLGQERVAVITESVKVPTAAESSVIDEGAPQHDGARTEQIPSKESVYSESADAVVSVAVEEQPQPITVEKVFIPEVRQEIKKVEQKVEAPIPYRKPTLTYISDSSPLFPEISKRPIVKKQPISSAPVAAIVPAVETHPRVVENKGGLLKKTLAITSLTVVAAVVFAIVFLGSLGVNTTVVVEQGKPASVAFSNNKTLCFIFGTCQKDQNMK